VNDDASSEVDTGHGEVVKPHPFIVDQWELVKIPSSQFDTGQGQVVMPVPRSDQGIGQGGCIPPRKDQGSGQGVVFKPTLKKGQGDSSRKIPISHKGSLPTPIEKKKKTILKGSKHVAGSQLNTPREPSLTQDSEVQKVISNYSNGIVMPSLEL
jgi:hypothetical protein